MEFWKFVDVIQTSALYFRRIDKFDDTFDGRIPLAIWSRKEPEIQQWFTDCKKEIFVNCWNLDEDEKPKMWCNYANNYGVRISSTVGKLRHELSHPSFPPEPYSDKPRDGFTMGKVEYIDFDSINSDHPDFRNMLDELGYVRPVFRKKLADPVHEHDYSDEHEYRVITRPGSASTKFRMSSNDDHTRVDVSVDNLVQEIRFAPSRDSKIERLINDLLAQYGLNIHVKPSSVL